MQMILLVVAVIFVLYMNDSIKLTHTRLDIRAKLIFSEVAHYVSQSGQMASRE